MSIGASHITRFGSIVEHALRRQRDVRVSHGAELGFARRMLLAQRARHLVVERHHRVGVRRLERVFVVNARLQFLVARGVAHVVSVFDGERNSCDAFGIFRLDLRGDFLRRGILRERHVEHRFPRRDQLRGVLPERVAHAGEARAAHEIAPLELLHAGAVGVPAQPVVPHLERRRVGGVERADFE